VAILVVQELQVTLVVQVLQALQARQAALVTLVLQVIQVAVGLPGMPVPIDTCVYALCPQAPAVLLVLGLQIRLLVVQEVRYG
jgi:hypothetical protein